MFVNLLLYGLLFFGLPFIVLRFWGHQQPLAQHAKSEKDESSHQPTPHPHLNGASSNALINGSAAQAPIQESSNGLSHSPLKDGEAIRAKNVVTAEKKDSVPKVVIAYATYSQGSLILAHKLLNFLTNILQEQAACQKDQEGCGGTDCGCASGGISNLSNGCSCCSGQAQGGKNGLSNGKGACSNGSSCVPLKKRVTPVVKVLELIEESDDNCDPKQGNRKGGLTTFSVDMLLDDPSYVLIIFIVSTFTEGKAPPRSQAFEAVLKDAHEDHRVPRNTLAQKRFAVFGLGDLAYGERQFNVFAKNLHEWCRSLGAPAFVVPPVYASHSNSASLFQMFNLTLERWLRRTEFYSDYSIHSSRKATAKKIAMSGKGASLGHASFSVSAGTSRTPSEVPFDASSDEGGAESIANGDVEEVDDVEDLVSESPGVAPADPDSPPTLLYPKLEQNLVKQGYHIVGSHSAVKLCRWTKSMLRGRGGCYKHTFYNINSSQCMEMTPSLACANKCVFCWRHHTNPVSRSFRWKQDPPTMLIAGGMAEHLRMIKQMRGVPGVTPERLAEAMVIRHCALSLVGEPIMYPQINEFCDLLHSRQISSFMVTNAQFPEQLRTLKPVTQLYLSVDAATPEELKRIDRPLFEDYWERCLECVRELRKKKQRTVFRMTLVNQYNNENILAYADLVEMAWPDFIEVKGVTYCGTSSTSTLTMKDNVPRHDEVIAFCEKLCSELALRRPGYVARTMTPDQCPLTPQDDPEIVLLSQEAAQRPYHIACEHEHSCCVLIALDKFYFNQRWHTWIDYDKFHALVKASEESRKSSEGGDDEQAEFTSLDYVAPTPSWATYKSKEKGFDPDQTRVLRKNGRPGVITSGC